MILENLINLIMQGFLREVLFYHKSTKEFKTILVILILSSLIALNYKYP